MVGDGGTGYSAQIMKAEVKVKTKLFLLIATVLMFAMGAIVGSIAQAIDLIGGEIIANLTAKVDRNGDVYIETQDGKTVLYQKKP